MNGYKKPKRLAPPFELNPDYHGGCGRPLQQPRTCVILEEFGIADIVAHTARAMCSTPIEFGCGMNSFEADYQRPKASEAGLVDFTRARGNTKPHLADLM